VLAFKPHGASIFQLAFAPDGSSVATCGSKPHVCACDAATGRPRWRTNVSNAGVALGLAYSPDGTRIAAVGWATVAILDAATGAELHTYPGRGYAVAYTPDGAGVVTHVAGGEHAIRVDVRTGRAERVPGLDQYPLFNRLRFSPDGRLLAAMGQVGVSVVDTRTRKCVERFGLSNFSFGVGALAFHPTAPVLVYSNGPRLLVYDRAGRAQRAERARSKKHIQDAAFTPDGKYLITVSNDTMAVLWDTTDWTEARTFAWDIGPLKAVAVAPDGSRAACGSDRGRVVVWDLDL
jgi:WD40 repeat protein